MYEVYVEATEPWHDGLRRAFNEAVLDYCEVPASMLSVEDYEASMAAEPGNNGADGQVAAYDADYVGIGANAHEDADGFVFSSLESAQRFADTMRRHVAGAGARVGVASLA